MGTIIRKNMVNSPAPSIKADSYKALGRVRKKFEKMNTARDIFAVYISTIPKNVLVRCMERIIINIGSIPS